MLASIHVRICLLRNRLYRSQHFFELIFPPRSGGVFVRAVFSAERVNASPTGEGISSDTNEDRAAAMCIHTWV